MHPTLCPLDEDVTLHQPVPVPRDDDPTFEDLPVLRHFDALEQAVHTCSNLGVVFALALAFILIAGHAG